MKTFLPASLLLVVFALAGSVALHAKSDHQEPGRHQRQGGFKPGALRKQLALTDEQVAKIKTEFAAQKDSLKATAQKTHAARAQLREAIQSGAPEPQLRSAAVNVGTAEGDLALERAALFSRIKPILTPEQLEKLQQLQHANRNR